jgi:hypothetical protein
MAKQQEKDFGMRREKILQKRWYLIVTAFSRVAQCKELLEAYHINTRLYQEAIHAARVIQKAWSTYKLKIEKEREKSALGIISSVIIPFVISFRIKKKNRAADMIAKFVKDAYDTSKLMRLMSYFKISGTCEFLITFIFLNILMTIQ